MLGVAVPPQPSANVGRVARNHRFDGGPTMLASEPGDRGG